MIPHLYLAGAVAVATLAGGFVAGVKVTNWHRDSEQLAIDQAAQKAGDKATTAAVEVIKGLRPQFTTINRAVEKEFHSDTRYTSPDCAITPAVWMQLEQAYRAAGGESFSGGTGVPTPAPAAGSNGSITGASADPSVGHDR